MAKPAHNSLVRDGLAPRLPAGEEEAGPRRRRSGTKAKSNAKRSRTARALTPRGWKLLRRSYFCEHHSGQKQRQISDRGEEKVSRGRARALVQKAKAHGNVKTAQDQLNGDVNGGNDADKRGQTGDPEQEHREEDALTRAAPSGFIIVGN